MGNLRDELKKWTTIEHQKPARRGPSTPPQHSQSQAPAASESPASQPDAPLSNTAVSIVSRFGSTPQPVLSRNSDFKYPDDWVLAGAALQPPGGGAGRILPVRVGIDFGTAYSKVAVQALDKVFFIDWSGVRKNAAPYLLPGELCRVDSGTLLLGRAYGSSDVFSNLKLPFLGDNGGDNEQQAAATAFLALVIRYARAWLYHTQSSIVRGRQLAWTLNVGCPTNSWSSNAVRNVYRGIAIRAWKLSQEKNISWDIALEQLQPLTRSAEDYGLDGIYLVPEFIAQIAGYVRSPQRRNGLHMLMDIGAGTVDVATFNVAYDQAREEDRYPIFASQVLPLGTHFLMSERLHALGAQRAAWDDLECIPELDDLTERFGAKRQLLESADLRFEGQLGGHIRRLLSYTRTDRYGKAPEWRQGLPVFITGGGAACRLYERALTDVCSSLKVPYRRTHFPLLQQATSGESFSARDFHRLSVAYGLTFDADLIGRILAPNEVDDAPAFDPVVDVRRERPDRDELYPK